MIEFFSFHIKTTYHNHIHNSRKNITHIIIQKGTLQNIREEKYSLDQQNIV